VFICVYFISFYCLFHCSFCSLHVCLLSALIKINRSITNLASTAGWTMFIMGASGGIIVAIVLYFAGNKADIAVAAKMVQSHLQVT